MRFGPKWGRHGYLDVQTTSAMPLRVFGTLRPSKWEPLKGSPSHMASAWLWLLCGTSPCQDLVVALSRQPSKDSRLANIFSGYFSYHPLRVARIQPKFRSAVWFNQWAAREAFWNFWFKAFRSEQNHRLRRHHWLQRWMDQEFPRSPCHPWERARAPRQSLGVGRMYGDFGHRLAGRRAAGGPFPGPNKVKAGATGRWIYSMPPEQVLAMAAGAGYAADRVGCGIASGCCDPGRFGDPVGCGAPNIMLFRRRHKGMI